MNEPSDMQRLCRDMCAEANRSCPHGACPCPSDPIPWTPVRDVMRVELHGLDATPGEWCPTCLLPSAFRVHGVLVDSDTLERQGSWGAVYCPECETTHHRPEGAGGPA